MMAVGDVEPRMNAIDAGLLDMNTRIQIDVPMDRIEAFCRKWKVRELALFGSVLREDFGPNSDVDVLVTFEQDGGFTFDNYPMMLEELTAIFGRDVDLMQREAVEHEPNYIRRQHVLNHLERVYVA